MDEGKVEVPRRRRWFGPARLRPESRSGKALSELAEDLRRETGLDRTEAAEFLLRLGRPARKRAA